MIESHKTFCRICTVLCGLEIKTDGARVIDVKGDRNHRFSQGYTCPKGRALGQLHHHPDAILEPAIGRGAAASAVDWDTALDDLAARLRKTIDEHGPGSVGVFMGSGLGMDATGYRMAEAFVQGIQTPAKFSPITIDGTAKTLVSALVGQFPGLSNRPDYERSELVIFAGINPLVSHGHNVALPRHGQTIKAVAARGQVWVIDPRENDTARLATRHLGPRPGSDYAVFAYLLRDLFERDAVTPAQEVDGLEDLRAAVEPFDRAEAARVTGLDEEELGDLAKAVAASGRVSVETGTGITMAASANVTQWLTWALMILTGSMNREGGVWFHPGFVNRLDLVEVPVISDVRHPGAPTRPDLSGIIGEWPCAALVSEIEAGNIRAVVNFGGAMARSFPESGRLAKALETLDTMVTLEVVGNETTALSTHILPTKGQLEREDIQLWDMLSARIQLQHTDRVLAPTGRRRSAWWIIAELMRRMGLDVPADVPLDDREEGADRAMLERLVPDHARASFAEVREAGAVDQPLELPAAWVDDHIARIGGWKLAPPDLVTQLEEFHAGSSTHDGALRLIPRRQRRKLNASPLALGERPELLIHPTDAAQLGIADGQEVRISTTTGTVTAPVRIDKAIRPGVVSLPHGHRDANVNVLTDSTKADELTGMALYGGFAVVLEPLESAR